MSDVQLAVEKLRDDTVIVSQGFHSQNFAPELVALMEAVEDCELRVYEDCVPRRAALDALARAILGSEA